MAEEHTLQTAVTKEEKDTRKVEITNVLMVKN